MKKILLFLLCVQAAFVSVSQSSERPKLVVGIVVDQMRQEYLYRFAPKFAEGGFKRLMNEGFMLKNAHYNYVPTITGPGHASVYTGSTPAIHGIISNEWYDKELKKEVNCVNDPQQKPVGSLEGKGSVSPWRLLSSTITDELKLFTQRRSRVISISFKDRGAVLPGGHLANAAYWYDGKSGKFITSTYYMNQLPDWVEKFNARNLSDQYLNQEWKTYYPIEKYIESGPDDSPYEQKFAGKDKPVFPYDLKSLRKKNGDLDFLASVPFANDFLTEMVKASLPGEQLGKHDVTDFLAISYSTTDIIGHAMGPNSVEIEDTYIRLDKNLEDLFKTLDATVGSKNYTVFLTADHAVNDVAQQLVDNHIPGGYFSTSKTKALLNDFLQKYFPGKNLIDTIDDNQVFFDHDAFQHDPKTSGVEMMIATELAMNFLIAQEGVADAFSESMIRQGRYDEAGIKGMVIRGYNQKRSGDLVFVLQPGWYNATKIQGTTHGSPYAYDTNVPILFYGKGIKKGMSVRYHTTTDIAPTLSVLLNIKFPSGCTGRPVEELFEQ
jgi:predicted AlkP superfamily pyrophosphatase or phosphodiesterase